MVAFQLRVLFKYDISYFRCSACGSLQTEDPYWLAESYKEDVSPDDVWYLSRNLDVFAKTKFLLKTLGATPDAAIVDFGGGLGLVPRLLSEQGWKAYCHDSFTESPFPELKWDGDKAVQFMIASELFEHLPDPHTDLQELFGQHPDYLYVRTSRYSGEGSDWFYLVPSVGQHVFFYSDRAMGIVAERFGYQVYLLTNQDALFSKKPLGALRKTAIQLGFSSGRLNILFRLFISRALT